MKKNIDNKKLDEMLENIYKSEPSHTFQYNSSYVSEKHTETAQNSEYVVSGVEHIRKGISPAKFVSIAAACIIAVTSGAVYLGNHVSTGGYSSPAAQSDISDITDEADISEEKSLFDKYLEEFEYEISNFDYECIKVTPNAEPNSYEESQNYIYSDICHDVNIVPAYENCSFIDTDGSSQSFAVTDEEFYCYIKKIDVPISENEATKFYTRQSYLVWKDADGNITKIRPSAEKVTADELENKLDCNYDIDIPQKVDSLLNDLSDESKEVYINDILVRPAVAEENRNGEPKISIVYNYYVYVNFNGQLVPVNAETMWYNSTSIMEFDDSYKATKNIPFFDGQLDNGHVILKKTFFWDCSGDEPVDISSYIAELNNNYWLETAERSKPAETSETIETTETSEISETIETTETTEIISDDKPFCFSDLADMDEESINALIEKYGDALQRTETGFTLCSYCLEQNGFDISTIEIYTDAYFNDCPDFNSTNHDIEINESNYTLKVHFPNQSENVSDEEKEMNEKFHNCPWAELILE
ncbi:MAG: hypothetical protein ACI4JM_01080 [Oscillospiraceae bacterium]